MRLLLLFLLLPLSVFAQSYNQHTIYLTKDSIPKNLTTGWLYGNGDDMAMAQADYNDAAWPEVNTEKLTNKDSSVHFKGIAWLRLHLNVDTSMVGKPLSLSLFHNGASEIYLDGKLLFTRGKVGTKDNTKNFDPQSFPLAFIIPAAGHHVLAVRYANWTVLSHNPIYTDLDPGFAMGVDNANKQFRKYYSSLVGLSACSMFLSGIFGALFLLHLLFFLYYRSDRNNLWFSLFNLCAFLLFLAPFVSRLSTSVRVNLSIAYYSFFVAVLTCFALSGFLNSLFSKKAIRFRIVAAACIIVTVLYAVAYEYASTPALILFCGITVEAVFLLIRAVVRKVPGARIIATGLMTLLVLLLIILTAIVTNSSFSVKNGTTLSYIVLAILAIAILSIPISISAYLARNFSIISKSLKQQLAQVQDLSEKARLQEAEKQRLLENRQEELEAEVASRTKEITRQKQEIEQQHTALKAEKKKTDDLLLNILPSEVADELKEKGSAAARLYENVSVLFTDFVDFTQLSEQLSPAELVAEIHHCFKAFDNIIEQYGLEKIKTVGDAYIAVSGLPITNEQHAQVVVQAALAIRDFISERKRHNPMSFSIRLGVHSGPVVAGIVGIKKFAYDIWGDTVNTAARMEQNSETGKVNISAATYSLISNDFNCTYRGELEAKHKGKMGMYFVEHAEVTEPV